MVATVNGGLDQHLNSKMILKEDGSYEMLIATYDNGKGTWEVDVDQLILSDESGNELIYKLLKVTDKELVTSHEVSIDTPSGEMSGKITLSYIR